MQSGAKLHAPKGVSSVGVRLAAVVSVLWLPVGVGALAQSAEVSQTTPVVAAVIPQQVRYAGSLPDRGGTTVEAVFKIYTSAEGGEPLWTETQQVAVKPDGSYAVLLGAASENGLPQTVFAAGQARWLGVTIDRGEEQRSPLSSVAYAMKAGDAESVGGVAAAKLATKDDLAKLSQSVATVAAAQPQVQAEPAVTPSGSGTTDYVPLWTASGTLGNSNIFQSASGNVGIGTTTPGGPLEVATGATGGANATMMLVQTNAASGNYYADIGLYNSNGLIGNLSALGAGYPAGNLFGANDVVFLGGQQKASTNLILLTNTSGALKFGTGGYAKSNERLRIGATGGVSIGNSYVGTDPGAGNLIVSGNTGIGTATPGAQLEVNGTAKFDGLVTFSAGQTFPGTGAGTITGVTASSPLTGGGTSGAVTVGLNTTALETTEETTYDSRYALLSGGITFSRYIEADDTSGPGTAAILGEGSNGSTGTFGLSDTGDGVLGASGTGQGVVGTVFSPAVGSEGVLGYTNTGFSSEYSTAAAIDYAGVWGDSSGPLVDNDLPIGVFGTADSGYAGAFINSGSASEALYVRNDTGTGAQINANGAVGDGLDAFANYGNGVAATINGGGDAVLGFNNTPEPGQGGVAGVAKSASISGGEISVYGGVWGDTGATSDSETWAIGVLGSADNGHAGVFVNTSNDWTTLYAYNFGTAGIGSAVSGTPGLFNTFMAGSPSGTCGIGGGSMSCTGPIKSLASAGGTRTVETYSVQSPENWMEDFGSGSLVEGHASISLDPGFAATVAGDGSYHVFITPRGDSKGLYVTSVTASGFEVRESGGGTSSIGFDYRIVAKRAGYEGQRMVDVTEAYNREMARAKLVKSDNPRPVAQVRKHSLLDRAPNTPVRKIVPPPVPRVPAHAKAVPARPVASK